MSVAELTWLAERAQHAQTIIELGSFCGRSTRAFGDNCPGTVYAVDPWGDDYIKDDGTVATYLDGKKAGIAFQKNLADLIAVKKVVPVKGKSLDMIGQLPKADLIFLDGDHRYEVVRDEIRKFKPLLNRRGLLCGHDYTHRDWPGVKRAVDEAFQTVGQCGSIWWAL